MKYIILGIGTVGFYLFDTARLKIVRIKQIKECSLNFEDFVELCDMSEEFKNIDEKKLKRIYKVI